MFVTLYLFSPFILFLLQVRASSAGPSPMTSNKGSINSGLDTLNTSINTPSSTSSRRFPTQLPAVPGTQYSVDGLNGQMLGAPVSLAPLSIPHASSSGTNQNRLSPVNKAPTSRGQGQLSPHNRQSQSGQVSPGPSGGYGQALGLGQMMSLTNVTNASSGSAASVTPLSSTTNSVSSLGSREKEKEKDGRDSAAQLSNGHAHQNVASALYGQDSDDAQNDDGTQEQVSGPDSYNNNYSNLNNNDWFSFSSPAEPPPRG